MQSCTHPHAHMDIVSKFSTDKDNNEIRSGTEMAHGYRQIQVKFHFAGEVCDIQSVTADEIVCLTPKPLDSDKTSFEGMFPTCMRQLVCSNY